MKKARGRGMQGGGNTQSRGCYGAGAVPLDSVLSGQVLCGLSTFLPSCWQHVGQDGQCGCAMLHTSKLTGFWDQLFVWLNTKDLAFQQFHLLLGSSEAILWLLLKQHGLFPYTRSSATLGLLTHSSTKQLLLSKLKILG